MDLSDKKYKEKSNPDYITPETRIQIRRNSRILNEFAVYLMDTFPNQFK